MLSPANIFSKYRIGYFMHSNVYSLTNKCECQQITFWADQHFTHIDLIRFENVTAAFV